MGVSNQAVSSSPSQNALWCQEAPKRAGSGKSGLKSCSANWLALNSRGLQQAKLWKSFLAIHTLADLPWPLSSEDTAGTCWSSMTCCLKCERVMKWSVKEKNSTFLPQIQRRKVNLWNSDQACGDCWGWWRWNGRISPNGSAERVGDIDTTIDKPQHLLVWIYRSSLRGAVVIGNVGQLWPWNQDLA